MKQKIKIGITDCAKYVNYEKWFAGIGNDIEIVKLSYHYGNQNMVESCDGIVLTGGEDVHPALYHKAEYLSLLNSNDINEARDAFEWKVLEKALELKKPVLGICRGLQLANVFLGGSLIPDIPTALQTFEHGKIEGIDQYHTLTVEKNSLLNSITGSVAGEVNSAHHQSVDQPAKDLKIIARSGSVVEGMQWTEPENKSWLLLVQWHPERMHDQQNPFALNINKAFITSCNQ